MKTVIESKVATPYAEALIQAARSTKKIDIVIKDLVTIISLFKKYPVLKFYLENPLVTFNDKQIAIKTVFSNFVDKVTLNFLLVLVEKNRIDCLNAIIKKFTNSLSEILQISIASITSAISLSENQKKTLLSALKEYCKVKEVKLICTVDSEILAGLKIQIDSQMIDLSVEGQMKKLIKYFDLNIQIT